MASSLAPRFGRPPSQRIEASLVLGLRGQPYRCLELTLDQPRSAILLRERLPLTRRAGLHYDPLPRPRRLFDLGFLEFDVLARDRIVFFEDELLGLGPRILLRHIIEAGARGAHELDFLRDGFGHGVLKVNLKSWANPTRRDREVKAGTFGQAVRAPG